MLRSYIEFAINGVSAIQNELQVSEVVDVESPFEESVYDFLVSNCYNVSTQVGCSGYRIDMAVHHPTLNGRFVLGIECDGATYHSARTARERDRLRQMVLEDIGWKIYRIWSTDWIKDPVTEGQKLLDSIKVAATCHVERGFEVSIDNKRNENDFVSKTIKSMSDAEYYGFIPYEETDMSKIKHHDSDNEDTMCATVLKYVVNNEYPIHFELLCSRASDFLNYKLNNNFREYVRGVVNSNLKEEVVMKKEFCWPKESHQAQVRIPIENGTVRSIDYISTEELAEAVLVIIKKSFGITHQSLIQATARIFGFKRTTKKIDESIQVAYNALINDELIINNEGKVIIS